MGELAYIFQPDEYRRIQQWLLGNTEAADMVMCIAQVSQVADDICDEGSREIGLVLSHTLFALNRNKFFQEHRQTIEPLLLGSVLMWEAANQWATHPRRETRMFAFVWRFILEQIVPVTAYLLGGHDHAVRVAVEMHDYYHADETFEEWEKEYEPRR